MKKLFIHISVPSLFFISFGINSCTKKPKINADTTGKNVSLIMGNPIDYDMDNLLIFPVGGNYNPQIMEKLRIEKNGNSQTISIANNGAFLTKNNTMNRYDAAAAIEYTNYDEESFDIRNLLFYNQQTRKSYLLALQNFHILSFSIHHELPKPLIYYRVVKKDINTDKKFNSADAVMFCVSDIDGKNLIEVTPEDEQFLEYFYYAKNQTILIKSSIDIDKNNKFTEMDETNFREMKLNEPAPGKEIFTKSLKDSIKNILK